jgi:hypothetical protein
MPPFLIIFLLLFAFSVLVIRPPQLKAVNISLYRIFIVLILLFQIGWFLIPDLNTLLDPYRYEEREKALMIWEKEKTPESKAVFDNERHLLYVHRQNRALLIFTVFLVIDGIGIYYFWNYGVKKTTA